MSGEQLKARILRDGERIEHLAPIEDSLTGTVKDWRDALDGIVPEDESDEDYPDGYSLLDWFEGILDLQVSKHGVYMLCGFGGPNIEVQIVVRNDVAFEIIERRAWWSPYERGVCVDPEALDTATEVWDYLRECGFGTDE